MKVLQSFNTLFTNFITKNAVPVHGLTKSAQYWNPIPAILDVGKLEAKAKIELPLLNQVGRKAMAYSYSLCFFRILLKTIVYINEL